VRTTRDFEEGVLETRLEGIPAFDCDEAVGEHGRRDGGQCVDNVTYP